MPGSCNESVQFHSEETEGKIRVFEDINTFRIYKFADLKVGDTMCGNAIWQNQI